MALQCHKSVVPALQTCHNRGRVKLMGKQKLTLEVQVKVLTVSESSEARRLFGTPQNHTRKSLTSVGGVT
jgi:hypothetical protein